MSLFAADALLLFCRFRYTLIDVIFFRAFSRYFHDIFDTLLLFHFIDLFSHAYYC